MKRASGFTLLEIVIAVFIILLLMGLAVPSLNGVMADRRLRSSLDRFNDLVRQAHERSLAEHRAYLIVLGNDGVSLRPLTFLKTEQHQPVDKVTLAPGDKWSIKFTAALVKRTPAEWIFWESGVCEPAEVSFAGTDGHWTAEYAPLSALAELNTYAAR
ncbi:MAG: prepilin-type N-terminal cleavage/methylation domain-containing protein [Verrucomicrobia bacterium]|nr:prepilin-type N-terminal cleavage/methylation domain-containing protein [Verrucomicrobiota bacterium]